MMSIAMPVWISMLRGVNLLRHNRIKMDALRDLYSSLKLDDPRTYVQSGNVIVRSDLSEHELARECEQLITGAFGLEIAVVVRTRDELADVVARNPLGDEALGRSGQR